MSSAHYKTSRALFLAHHWQRYLAFDGRRDSDLSFGRIASCNEDSVDIVSGGETRRMQLIGWSEVSLREPKAAESAPSVHEVLSIGDWVGVCSRGLVILYAPCGDRLTTPSGTTVLQTSERFEKQAREWFQFLTQVRAFFVSRSFIEITTPTLAPSPGTEPFLDPLSVTIESDGVSIEKFMITSPEFHLKKALAAGAPRIFEVAKCFRNREGGSHHRVEFHMLEWYRSFASLEEIASDVEALIVSLSPKARMIRLTMRELFARELAVSLTPALTRDELATEAGRLQVRIAGDDSFDDIFHRIFLEKLEPRLNEIAKGGPLLISGYPPSMAALARIGPDGFADRFEVYWNGFELCNAFHELNDPTENRKRFDADNRAKEASGRKPVPLDDELLRAFDLGVPPSGGIAMGLERLFMAVNGISDIAEVRPFQR